VSVNKWAKAVLLKVCSDLHAEYIATQIVNWKEHGGEKMLYTPHSYIQRQIIQSVKFLTECLKNTLKRRLLILESWRTN
jgi:hypothetical protein